MSSWVATHANRSIFTVRSLRSVPWPAQYNATHLTPRQSKMGASLVVALKLCGGRGGYEGRKLAEFHDPRPRHRLPSTAVSAEKRSKKPQKDFSYFPSSLRSTCAPLLEMLRPRPVILDLLQRPMAAEDPQEPTGTAVSQPLSEGGVVDQKNQIYEMRDACACVGE